MSVAHNVTIDVDILLKKCKARYVEVDYKMFQALRYEMMEDGEICVIQGPIAKPRQVDKERMYSVECNLIVPARGCAVICHGLISASYLNGNLGETRSDKNTETGYRLGVHFEKKGVKSALVKPENLRIAFDLPSED